MFSAFKRLTGKNEGIPSNSSEPGKTPGHQTMSTSLQRKFARGVQYNMKIVIKGDRNVGKTCLFYRLQGKKFIEEYIPTEEIQVASIHWNYKATDDIVKVEVWDVVDRGKKKKRFDGLKLENSQIDIPEEPALDAEFLDVYKGTNGVIMMMDLTKTWTFDYAQREVSKVPEHIPIIILANHCDMSHHRTVTSDHVLYYIESISSARSAQVRYAESSMRNGFGLKLLHKFFNLPFLQLQKETLLRQLQRNEEEITATSQELDMYFESDEANYNKFLDGLVKKRREIADLNANVAPQVPIPSSFSSQQLSNPAQLDVIRRSSSGPIVIGAGNPIPYNPLNGAIYKKPVGSESQTSKSSSQSSGFISKTGVKVESIDRLPDIRRMEISPITSVEEFCPDGGQLDRTFLDDVQVQYSPHGNVQDAAESDSEEDTGNPLVSEFQDDFEPDDATQFKPIPSHSESRYNMALKRPVGGDEGEADKTQPDEYDMKQTMDEFDSTINSEISEITSEAFDTWMSSDTKWRRSPEGGEDVSGTSQTLDYSGSTVYDDSTSVTSSNVHMELLSAKHHTSTNISVHDSDGEQVSASNNSLKEKKKEKTEKKHKTKKSKDKDKTSKTDKKHKKRSREESASHRDELEEFLNGSVSPTADSAYEVI